MLLTILQTRIKLYGSTYVLKFISSDDIAHKLDEWNKGLDRIVFEEQVATGAYHGRFSILGNEFAQMMMEQAKQRGEISPYWRPSQTGG